MDRKVVAAVVPAPAALVGCAVREATAACAAQATYVITVGSFLCAADACMRDRSAARLALEVDLPAAHVGFRTVARAGRSRSTRSEENA